MGLSISRTVTVAYEPRFPCVGFAKAPGTLGIDVLVAKYIAVDLDPQLGG